MVLAGNEGPSQSELERTINMLIERQTKIDKRVERLESLEGTKWDDGRGCVSFEDFDIVANAATARVDVAPELAENGDFKASQATLYWQGWTTGAGAMVNLLMRINNNAGANYEYSWNYSKAGAMNNGNAGGQTSMIVGRIGAQSGFSYGKIVVPFYPSNLNDHQALGHWTGYETVSGVGSRQENGNFGGSLVGIGAININRFDFFPSAGNFDDFVVYLYVRCPQLTAGFLPDD